ncbi:TadE/TadG family type IV pilus assembly protein [Rhodopseudomonas palustris]|uniref:Putative Flp pilus-assembly TadG-like N-terminal domain-containing protein n=1 Tax=Rhodopseudomonas palustris (strain BisB18) TaxID=316056 RepID=Q21BV5_RHOPB
MAQRLSGLFDSFHHDRRGNIAILFAFSLIPLLVAIGCAIDYARATQIRSKMQSAADAASVGSVSKASPAFLAAGSMTTDGPIAVGSTDATNIFNGNMASQSGYTLSKLDAAVTKSGATLTSTVTFSASVATTFLTIIGKTALAIGGTSVSTSSMPVYIDFYLLLDNSPSMGVGATPTDVATMVDNTSDKCAFACHDVNDEHNYYELAKTLGVKTRIDVLRDATQQLMDTAAATATYPNQFRMAIYDFGASAQSAALRRLFALSSSLSSAKTAAGAIDLMTVKGQNDNDDRDTSYSKLLPAIDKQITAAGAGTSDAPQKYLLFVSDGVADETNAGCAKTMKNAFWGNKSPRCQSPIDPALCKAMTDRGVKVAVLYTTYLALPLKQANGDPSWYASWIAPFNVGPYGPSPNSEIANNMKACASPGFYFEVSPTDGIADAMNAIFRKAVADARISS